MKNMNRRYAIRARCLDCSGFSKKEVRECPIVDCSLFPFRMGTGKQDPEARDRALRSYCLECMNDQPVEVSLCPSGDCPLYSFRQTRSARSQKCRIPSTTAANNVAEGVR